MRQEKPNTELKGLVIRLTATSIIRSLCKFFLILAVLL